MNGLVIVANGMDYRNDWISLPNMIQSFLKDDVLQIWIPGGRFAKSKIPGTIDNINHLLAQYPNTKELVIDYSHEICPQLACTTDVHALSMLDNINCNNITIFYGDINVGKNINYNFQKNINFLGVNYFEWRHRQQIECHCVPELEYRRNFDQICSRKFTNLIGVVKSHRIYLASELYKQGYFDKGYTSCVAMKNHSDSGKTVQSENEHKKDYFYVQDIEDRFNQLLPHFEVADIEVMDRGDASQNNSTPLNWFSDSYFNIVCETCFSNDWPYNELFITEKTFKPIIHQIPFIVAGSAGTLEYLKSIGYETFPEIFDESYDNEPNSYKRMAMIIEQIKSACDDPELHNKVYNIQDKLKHNRNQYFDNTCLK